MNIEMKLKDESGIALITALLILVLITVLGSAGIMTSTTDVKISDNFQEHMSMFYTADGGWQVGTEYINTISTGIISTPTNPNGTIGNNSYTYSISASLPGQSIPGYGSEWKKIYYTIVSTGSGSSTAASTITVRVSKPTKSGY